MAKKWLYGIRKDAICLDNIAQVKLISKNDGEDALICISAAAEKVDTNKGYVGNVSVWVNGDDKINEVLAYLGIDRAQLVEKGKAKTITETPETPPF